MSEFWVGFWVGFFSSYAVSVVFLAAMRWMIVPRYPGPPPPLGEDPR